MGPRPLAPGRRVVSGEVLAVSRPPQGDAPAEGRVRYIPKDGPNGEEEFELAPWLEWYDFGECERCGKEKVIVTAVDSSVMDQPWAVEIIRGNREAAREQLRKFGKLCPDCEGIGAALGSTP